MIVPQTENRTSAVGFKETRRYSIKASAKTFRILSDGIYKNKVAAVIREYSTNALDAHIEAGNDDRFDVHLPSIYDPTFKVRDYGMGLDYTGVMDTFTTYGESTKEESNAYNGTLGLGSKAAFAYTKTFTITSYFNGKKMMFSAYINDHGEPDISALPESDTAEPNGLEISIPVQQHDINQFRNTALSIYYWFERRPNTNIALDYSRYLEMIHAGKDDDWFIHTGLVAGSNFHVAMGNVLYPVDRYALANVTTLTDAQREILDKRIVIKVPNGAVMFAPSREELEYNKFTIDTIKTALDKIHQEISDLINASLSSEKSTWKRTVLYREKFSSRNPLHLTGTNVDGLFNGKIALPRGVKVYEYQNENVSPWKRLMNQADDDKQPLIVLHHMEPTSKVTFYTHHNKNMLGVGKFEDWRRRAYGKVDVFIVGDAAAVAQTIAAYGDPDFINLDGELPATQKATPTTCYYWPAHLEFSRSNFCRMTDQAVSDLEGVYLSVNNFTEMKTAAFPSAPHTNTKQIIHALIAYWNSISDNKVNKIFLIRENDLPAAMKNKKLKSFHDFVTGSIKGLVVPIDEVITSQLPYSERDMIYRLKRFGSDRIHNAETRTIINQMTAITFTNDSVVEKYLRMVEHVFAIKMDTTSHVKAKELLDRIKKFCKKYPFLNNSHQNNENYINYINAMDLLYDRNPTLIPKE